MSHIGCEACGHLSVDAKMQATFNVRVCSHCASNCPEYKLISKGTAKSTFLVSDGDLKRLNFIKKANPHKPQWADMCLYLTSQVSAIARGKHGNVRQAQHLRIEDRIKNRLTKRSAQQVEEEEQQEKKEGSAPSINANEERVRKRIQREYGEGGSGKELAQAGVDIEEI